jgi:hypothetical protein
MNNRYTFEGIKNVYEGIKPIRGRAKDFRPLGDRRRDWERVEKIDEDTYAYVLYNTNCVTIKRDNSITLNTNRWNSISTAEFMTSWSPFIVVRKSKVLWALINNVYIPILKPLTIRRDENGLYAPEPTTYLVKMLNKQRARAARKLFDPFLKFSKSILKLSDGWINFETRAEVRDEQLNNLTKANRDVASLSKWETYVTTDESLYMTLLCELTDGIRPIESRSKQHKPNEYFRYDNRFSYDAVRKKLYKMQEDQDSGLFDIVRVSPSDKCVKNIITSKY